MERYEAPVAEIVTFAAQDIVRTSCYYSDPTCVAIETTPYACEAQNWVS